MGYTQSEKISTMIDRPDLGRPRLLDDLQGIPQTIVHESFECIDGETAETARRRKKRWRNVETERRKDNGHSAAFLPVPPSAPHSPAARARCADKRMSAQSEQAEPAGHLSGVIVAKQTGKTPIIIIPGVTGSELVNRMTGEKLWPDLFPEDKEAMALPISSTTLSENRDDVVASRVIETAQLIKFMPKIGVYGALLKALENQGGYRRGDIDAPQPDGDRDTYYLFAYDWRRDNVESARRLAEKIAEIKRRTNRPDLRFDIIAHSMGGLIARYFAMYGDADVLGDRQPRPDWRGAQSLRSLVLFATPNAGSMDALRSLIYGYSITEANKPRINPFKGLGRVTIFTAPSVYQLLPRGSRPGFTTPSSTRSKSIFTTSRPGSAATGLRPSTPRLRTEN